MIVNYLDVVGVAVTPPKTHSPPVVDPYAVLAFSIAREPF
jgi:hypothetical protein